jgi:hypothetical protein
VTGERPEVERINTDVPPPSGIQHKLHISIQQPQNAGLIRSRAVGFAVRLAQRLRLSRALDAGAELTKRLISKVTVRGPRGPYSRAEQERVKAAAIELWPPDGTRPKGMRNTEFNDLLCTKLGHGDHLTTYRRAFSLRPD